MFHRQPPTNSKAFLRQTEQIHFPEGSIPTSDLNHGKNTSHGYSAILSGERQLCTFSFCIARRNEANELVSAISTAGLHQLGQLLATPSNFNFQTISKQPFWKKTACFLHFLTTMSSFITSFKRTQSWVKQPRSTVK